MIEGLFQPMHLLIIAGIALLILGPKKLPELGKGHLCNSTDCATASLLITAAV